MQLELLLGLATGLSGIVVAWYSVAKRHSQEEVRTNSNSVRMETKLEGIHNDIKEIKAEMKMTDKFIRDHETRIVILERDMKEVRSGNN